MKDIVLDGFVKNFAESRGFSGRPEHEIFEAFATSSLLRKYHQSDILDIEDDVLVGGGGDGGIDSVVVLVNGRPAMTKQDVDFFVERLHRLEVEFIFVQAKASPAFNSADIGAFGFGVEQFFAAVGNSDPRVAFNSNVRQIIDLTCYVYEQSIYMEKNPRCYLYYVTTGDWTDAVEPRGRIDHTLHTLRQTNLFLDVQVKPIGASLLKDLYRALERAVIGDVEFSRAAVFPKITGVDDAYIGLLPGDEFIRLVSTDDGQLNRNLFYDNVRDYQGNNPVNDEIGRTLKNDDHRSNFALLNNGVTIVARSIKRIGDTFQISDFQIVNGCQTTHILFENRHNVQANTFVPVKLVATNDSEIVAQVVKATNNQTAVLPEALESLMPFHKELEDFYNTREAGIDATERIFYERRSKQYAMDRVSQANIVTLTKQIKSFIGMFLDEPHSHPRYYGELLKSYAGRIFANDHGPEPYYASGVALGYVERWLNASTDQRDLRPYKYQLLMLLRIMISGLDVPKLNGRDISAYSLKIGDTIRRSDAGTNTFGRATAVLRESLVRFRERNRDRGDTQRNPPHRLRAFTEQLKSDYRRTQSTETARLADQASGVGSSSKTASSLGSEEVGDLLWYDAWRNYGFIRKHGGGSIFVHQSEIGGIPWHLRTAGTRVRYTVAQDPKADSPGAVVASRVKLVKLELAVEKHQIKP